MIIIIIIIIIMIIIIIIIIIFQTKIFSSPVWNEPSFTGKISYRYPLKTNF